MGEMMYVPETCLQILGGGGVGETGTQPKADGFCDQYWVHEGSLLISLILCVYEKLHNKKIKR